MSLIPGTNLIETYRTPSSGRNQRGLQPSGARAHDVGQPGDRADHPIGKTAISLLSAFAIVTFFPFRNTVFCLIFITLMLPVEVRINPTYEVVASLGMLNTYA